MKKNEVQALLYQGMGAFLRSPEFRLVKSDGAFVHKTTSGIQKIFVPLYDYNPKFVFSATVGIRVDEVESIFNRFSGADSKGQKLTLTSITQLVHFTKGNPKDYAVSSPEEIARALGELSILVTERIIPFLDSHRTIAELDAAMNSESPTDFDSSMPLARAMHGAILAKLNKNSRYGEIVQRFSSELERFHAQERGRFERLISFLDNSVA